MIANYEEHGFEVSAEQIPHTCTACPFWFGFWKDIYDPVTLGFVDSEFETMEELNYEKVLYWMPMLEPPEEVMQDD